MSQPFGATNEPGTCLWCGRKLRREYFTEKRQTERTRPPSKCYACDSKGCFEPVAGQDNLYRCKCCNDEACGNHVYEVVKRTPVYDKPGPKGDGFFCTLPCAYAFAVCLAGHGRLSLAPFLGSTMAVRPAVNRMVASSSLARGATSCRSSTRPAGPSCVKLNLWKVVPELECG